MANKLWGIDLGGTKIEGVVLSARDNPEPLARLRVNTDAERGYESIIDRIAELIDSLADKVGQKPKSVGFGTPGVLDPFTGLLKNSNTQCLNGQPLARDLEKRLKISVTTANDANCFALAENLFGAARGAQCVFGIIMGTGVGGGIVINGQARYGCQGIAGEWGHNIIEPDGWECYCGKRGCVETVISGPGLERYYEEKSGKRLPLTEIAQLGKTGNDKFATETIERMVEYFARSVGVVINILDPDVIVLGGGVSNVEALYTKALLRLSHYVFNDTLRTKVVSNQLGDSAGVFGAALLY